MAEARRLAAADGVDVVVEQRDVFTLGRDYAGAFDGVWEYTCFCAIDPARREEYVRVLHDILRPGGLLLACFFPLREGGDGPPFPVSRADIEPGPRGSLHRAAGRAAGPLRRARRRDLEWLVEAAPDLIAFVDRPCVGVLGLAHFSLAARERQASMRRHP